MLGLCNYTDHLHLSDKTLAFPTIVGNINTQGGINARQTGNSSFDIVDKQADPHVCDMGNRGTATVTYALNSNDYCVLNITDGTDMDNPDDHTYQCYGNLAYLGMSYDGTWSYSYSMIFAKKS